MVTRKSEGESPFLDGVTDLFGAPVPRSRGGRGKPPHVPSPENRRYVQLSLACGFDEAEIAAGLRITTKTLNRHYFHELAGKRSARQLLEMKNLSAIVSQVEAGKTSAMSLLDKKLKRMEQDELSARYAQRPPREPKLGKKEARKAEAEGVTGKFAPPPPPGMFN